MKAGDLAGDGGDLPLCWATKYLLLVSGPTTKMNLSFPESKPGSPASSCLPRVSRPIWTSHLSVWTSRPSVWTSRPSVAHKAHFAVLKLLSKSIFGSAAFWTDTPVSPGFSRQHSEAFLCSSPDSHMFQQVLRALYQNDAIKWGVLTHHTTGAVLAHHKLQQERGG